MSSCGAPPEWQPDSAQFDVKIGCTSEPREIVPVSAVAVKGTEPSPATVASTVMAVSESGRVRRVEAVPVRSVSGETGERLPPPDVTAKATATPGTGLA